MFGFVYLKKIKLHFSIFKVTFYLWKTWTATYAGYDDGNNIFKLNFTNLKSFLQFFRIKTNHSKQIEDGMQHLNKVHLPNRLLASIEATWWLSQLQVGWTVTVLQFALMRYMQSQAWCLETLNKMKTITCTNVRQVVSVWVSAWATCAKSDETKERKKKKRNSAPAITCTGADHRWKTVLRCRQVEVAEKIAGKNRTIKRVEGNDDE